jgi:hypothetical protein
MVRMVTRVLNRHAHEGLRVYFRRTELTCVVVRSWVIGHNGCRCGGAAVGQDVPVRERLRVMWDYDAFPVWMIDDGVGVGASHDIDVGLRDDLREWSDRVTDAMWGPNGPDAPGWSGPGEEVVAGFNHEGEALATRLEQNLGAGAIVEYWPI